MKLSIGLIVKNETKVLRRCLEALQPVLTQVDSELIIADTGSEDDTVAIAREFTDQVFSIEWNNNFAEARNHTLRRAKGEWFMYIDADEFLEDATDLIQFFNTGEYLKYNSATIQQKNLVGDGTQFDMFYMLRLAKRTARTKFDGIIHEGLVHADPRRDLKVNAYHTGYFFADDPEGAERKHQRNISLLMRAHRRDPLDARLISLIANEYVSRNDMPTYKKWLDRGMDLVGNKPEDALFHYFYHHLVQFYTREEEGASSREEARQLAEKYQRLCKKQVSVTTLDIYFLVGLTYSQESNYREAVAWFDKAAELFALYQQDRLDATEAVFDILECARPTFNSQLNYTRALSHTMLEEYESAFECYARIDQPDQGALDTFFELLEAGGYYDRAAAGYRMVLSVRPENKGNFLILRDYYDGKLVASPRMKEMLASFDVWDCEPDDYIRLQRLRRAFFTGDEPGFLRGLEPFIERERLAELKDTEPNFYFNVGYMAMRAPLAFRQLIEVSELDDANYLIPNIAALNDNIAELAVPYIRQQDTDSSVSAYWMSILFGCGLRAEKAEDSQLEALFDAYADAMRRYMDAVMRPDVLTETGMALLPGAYRFALYAERAVQAQADGDDLAYARAMKAALPCDERYSGAVKRLTRLFTERRAREKADRELMSSKAMELQLLTHNLRAAIYKMIDKGQTAAAQTLLAQYEAINPNDEGLPALRRKLEG